VVYSDLLIYTIEVFCRIYATISVIRHIDHKRYHILEEICVIIIKSLNFMIDHQF